MEEFFQYNSRRQIFWVEDEAFPANQSAFVRYAHRPNDCIRSKSCALESNCGNVNKRMMVFLRRNWIPVTEGKEPVRGRCHQHMINERMRREKEKQSYSSLHSLLPPGTKSDKNSIVQAAAKEVGKLQKYKAELEWRNKEIEAILAAGGGKTEGTKIKLRVASPSSGIDSMVEVLKCLKNMGFKSRAIQSKFSAQELSAVLEIESEIEAAEVEKVVQRTLFEVERKLRFNFPI